MFENVTRMDTKMFGERHCHPLKMPAMLIFKLKPDFRVRVRAGRNMNLIATVFKTHPIG